MWSRWQLWMCWVSNHFQSVSCCCCCLCLLQVIKNLLVTSKVCIEKWHFNQWKCYKYIFVNTFFTFEWSCKQTTVTDMKSIFPPSSLCPLNCGSRMLPERWWLCPRTNTGVSLPRCTLFLHSWGFGSLSLKYSIVYRLCLFTCRSEHRNMLLLSLGCRKYLQCIYMCPVHYDVMIIFFIFPILFSLLSW